MFIADWWHFVYSTLMGKSIFMMLMFGWELFLLPIYLVYGVICALIGTATGKFSD